MDNELFVFLPFFLSVALKSVTMPTIEFNKIQFNHLIKGLTPFLNLLNSYLELGLNMV